MIDFTAAIYRDGTKLAGCYIQISTGFGRTRSIGYSSSDSPQDKSYNEMIGVDSDAHTLHLKPMMGGWSGQTPKLTAEGAAEKL